VDAFGIESFQSRPEARFDGQTHPQMIFDAVAKFGFFDHGRMVADLLDTARVIENDRAKGKCLAPPEAVLAQVGDDMLHALPDDQGAFRLRHSPAMIGALRNIEHGTLFDGRLSLPSPIAAVILGRRDLRAQFTTAGRFDFRAGLRWFVLHGVVEHRLWHVLSRHFVLQLIGRSVPWKGAKLTPLEMLVLDERPELAARFDWRDPSGCQLALTQGLFSEGVRQYELFWCLSAGPDGSSTDSLANPEDVVARWRAGGNIGTELFEPAALSVIEQALGLPAPSAPGPVDKSAANRRSSLVEQYRAEAASAGCEYLPLLFSVDGLGCRALGQGSFGIPNEIGTPVFTDSLDFVLPLPSFRARYVAIELHLPEPRDKALYRIAVNGSTAALSSTEDRSALLIAPLLTDGAPGRGYAVVSLERLAVESPSAAAPRPWAILERAWSV